MAPVRSLIFPEWVHRRRAQEQQTTRAKATGRAIEAPRLTRRATFTAMRTPMARAFVGIVDGPTRARLRRIGASKTRRRAAA